MMRLFLNAVLGLLLVALTAPAMAELKLGGRIFVDCYYLDRDRENAVWKGLGNNRFTNTAIQLPNITRFYVRWTNEENVGLYVEFGLGQRDGNTIESSSDGVHLRQAYGWWDVTPKFQILAGATTTPISPLYPFQLVGTRSGSLNIIGAGYGELYSGRIPQVRGTFHFNRNVRLAIALVDPNWTMLGDYAPYGTKGTEYQTSSKLPRIDIGMPVYAGCFKIYPSFLYQYRTVDLLPGGSVPSGIDNDIDTYIGSLGVKAGIGPVEINVEGNWGKNWGNTGGTASAGISPPAIHASATIYDNCLDNTETYSWFVDVAYTRIFGRFTPHLVYGQMKTRGDKNPMRYKSRFWGISIPTRLTEGLSLIPEFMWYDDGGDNRDSKGAEVDNGRYAIYGVQFLFRF